MLYVLYVMRRVLLCMLEAVNGELCLPEVMRWVLPCLLEGAVRAVHDAPCATLYAGGRER